MICRCIQKRNLIIFTKKILLKYTILITKNKSTHNIFKGAEKAIIIFKNPNIARPRKYSNDK